MRRRVQLAGAAVLVTVGALLPGGAAEAKDASIAFSANDLPTWQANGIVWSLAQAGGTVFAGGTFTAVRPPGVAAGGTGEQAAKNFVALDAVTGAPTGCQLSFTNAADTATVRALKVSPDQTTLYVGGTFGTVTAGGVATGVGNIAAIDIATCTVKTSFRPSLASTVRAIDVTDTTVYAGGDFTSAGTTGNSRVPRTKLASFSLTGQLQPWNPAVDDTVRTVAVTPDGTQVFVGGNFTTVNGASSQGLGVVDTVLGTTVHAFPGFFPANSATKKVIFDAGTNAAYVANEGTGYQVFDGRTAISLSDYSQIWRDTCLGATQSLAIYQGVLYAASHAHDCSTMGEWPDGVRQHFTANTLSSPSKLPWFPNTNEGIGEGIGPRDLVVSNGYLWSGGEFTTVNGHAQQSLTRFGSTDGTTPGAIAASVTSVQPGIATVHWRTAVDSDDRTLTYNVYRDGSSTPIYTTQGDSAWWNRPQLSFTDSGLTPGSSHSYKITASDGNSTSAATTATVTVVTAAPRYPTAVLADSPSLYWRLNESSSTFVSDSTPNNDNGVYPSTGVTYRGGTGALVGDSNAGVTLTGTANLYNEFRQPSPGSFSTELWFKTTTTAGGELSGFDSNPTKLAYLTDRQVYMTNAGKLGFGVGRASAVSAITSPLAYNDGAWHHVVAEQSTAIGGGLRLYVDGKLVASNTKLTAQSYGALGGYWRVGGDVTVSGYPSPPTNTYFQGSVDEFAAYPTALSATRVAAHYAAGR